MDELGELIARSPLWNAGRSQGLETIKLNQRATLTPAQLRLLTRTAERRDAAEADYRAAVVAVLTEGGSFATVRDATGLSTNTLQRWKRESGK